MNIETERNLLEGRLRASDASLVARIHDALREQLEFPSSYAVLLHGSVAEGIGNAASDLDVLIVPDRDQEVPPSTVTAVLEGPDTTRVIDIEFMTKQAVLAGAADLSACDVKNYRSVLHAVSAAHRIRYAYPLQNHALAREIFAAYDPAVLRYLQRVAGRHQATICLGRAKSLIALGQTADAKHAATEGLAGALEAWLADRDETYASNKWLVSRLERALLDSAVLARVKAVLAVSSVDDAAQFVQQCIEISDCVGFSDFSQPDYTIRSTANVRSWSLGSTFLVRADELVMLDCDTASVRDAVADGTLSLEDATALGEKFCRDLGTLHRYGFVELIDRASGEAWRRSCTIETVGSGLQLTTRALRVTAPRVSAITRLPCTPAAVAGCGINMCLHLIDLARVRDDGMGACLAGRWHELSMALRQMVVVTCRAAAASRGYFPECDDAEPLEVLRQLTVPAKWLDGVAQLRDFGVCSTQEAGDLIAKVEAFVAMVSGEISESCFDNVLSSALDYVEALRVTGVWARCGREVGVKMSLAIGERMVEQQPDLAGDHMTLMRETTKTGAEAEIRIRPDLYVRFLGVTRKIDLAHSVRTYAAQHSDR